MTSEESTLPKVALSRRQTIRLIVVGIFVVLALVRVVPDFVRVGYPLQFFGYQTDGDAVVTTVASRPSEQKPGPIARATAKFVSMVRGKEEAPATAMPDRGDPIERGDKVRIDRTHPSDRKAGIAGRGYTFENPNRFLPIERNGTERILHMRALTETAPYRFTDLLRVALCLVAVALGAMLFLVKPSIATAAFFVFSLTAVDPPSTYFDTLVSNPWRQILPWIHDTLRGAARPALMLFALCLIDGDNDAPRERAFAWIAAALALVLGTLHAYAQWRLTYGALPAASLDRAFAIGSYVASAGTVVALLIAFVRARANDRHRIGWIAAAFVLAGIARLLSDSLYPSHIKGWQNSLLVSMTIVPIVTIWIAVIRHHFFNIDFVVNRAVVYVALTAALIGTVSILEEIGTYAFYQNTDIAYIVLIGISLAVGSFTGRIAEFVNRLVDRFIFRDRLQQRQALEFIAGYILDAETVEDVYRALLQDAAHALKLTFGGILGRQPDGGYALAESYDWPADFDFKLGPTDELTRAITRTRGALTFSGKDTRLIQESFPNERLTFAAPIFFDRTVSGIVVYGHNVSGLDLDPEERELLVRVVAHASIALNTIELNRYRTSNVPAPLPSAAT